MIQNWNLNLGPYYYPILSTTKRNMLSTSSYIKVTLLLILFLDHQKLLLLEGFPVAPIHQFYTIGGARTTTTNQNKNKNLIVKNSKYTRNNRNIHANHHSHQNGENLDEGCPFVINSDKRNNNPSNDNDYDYDRHHVQWDRRNIFLSVIPRAAIAAATATTAIITTTPTTSSASATDISSAMSITPNNDILVSTATSDKEDTMSTTPATPKTAPTTTTTTGIDLQNIITVVLNSPNEKIGVGLTDVQIIFPPGNNIENDNRIKQILTVPAVTSVQPNGQAEKNGIHEGMVILPSLSLGITKKTSAEVVSKIQSGPYPILLQFYNLSNNNNNNGVDGTMITPKQALEQAQKEAAAAAAKSSPSSSANQGPKLSTRGAGLGVKTIQPSTSSSKSKSSCLPASRGDTVTIQYEARVASPGGPIYDSTNDRNGKPTTFVLGDGQAINGVDIGIGGMCPGEIRELDIPASLGYGRFGSDIFDIPGDVRLWWRVELLDLIKGKK